MRLYRKWIEINTNGPCDFLDITEKVEEVLRESKVKNGMLFLNSTHNTATIFIQENDRTIFEDMKEMFERLLPLKEKYHHNYEGPINATAHLKTNLVGQTLSLPIENGKIILGTWQRIIFVEWFERRKRKVLVTIIGD